MIALRRATESLGQEATSCCNCGSVISSSAPDFASLGRLSLLKVLATLRLPSFPNSPIPPILLIAHLIGDSMSSSSLPVVMCTVADLSAADRELVESALAARLRAFAPYSKFLVGAALRTPKGTMFVGCNVENASYGLTICAERTAMFSAVAAGEKQVARLAIASAGGVSPCGACRQVLAEFAPQLPILLIDANRPEQVAEVNLADLLPGRFVFPQR